MRQRQRGQETEIASTRESERASARVRVSEGENYIEKKISQPECVQESVIARESTRKNASERERKLYRKAKERTRECASARESARKSASERERKLYCKAKESTRECESACE